MKRFSLRVALCLAMTMAGLTTSQAADTPIEDAVPEPRPTEDASLQDFIKANPDCLEFTDQCSHCVVLNGVAECSTAEIACIKQSNQCTKRMAK
ncbi:hypothetical protein LAC81_34310 [Ensifer adhaerens]|uniref:hypothetical protein n=1 Tax=Ensifer adhaerens TaxID=106592 RepID=UPI001CBE0203|nr:hypothetical protein [Ensifer adhaerens]MBZ7925776.1 hypothetical protein [Ensifer adhaerens]UAX97806.1 hypothetical protein LAC78_29520 [Ensifer adhaerens]UAY05184.1 hypothetical protein LAC80_30785 [Ensifer adhaerens]UAY12565.1 hypothetical protein LAC81_34310 [Ensifer adhaerens]